MVKGFQEEIASGRMFTDLIASLYRVTAGFVLAALLGIPLGLVLGRWRKRRRRGVLDGAHSGVREELESMGLDGTGCR